MQDLDNINSNVKSAADLLDQASGLTDGGDSSVDYSSQSDSEDDSFDEPFDSVSSPEFLYSDGQVPQMANASPQGFVPDSKALNLRREILTMNEHGANAYAASDVGGGRRFSDEADAMGPEVESAGVSDVPLQQEGSVPASAVSSEQLDNTPWRDEQSQSGHTAPMYKSTEGQDTQCADEWPDAVDKAGIILDSGLVPATSPSARGASVLSSELDLTHRSVSGVSNASTDIGDASTSLRGPRHRDEGPSEPGHSCGPAATAAPLQELRLALQDRGGVSARSELLTPRDTPLFPTQVPTILECLLGPPSEDQQAAITTSEILLGVSPKGFAQKPDRASLEADAMVAHSVADNLEQDSTPGDGHVQAGGASRELESSPPHGQASAAEVETGIEAPSRTQALVVLQPNDTASPEETAEHVAQDTPVAEETLGAGEDAASHRSSHHSLVRSDVLESFMRCLPSKP